MTILSTATTTTLTDPFVYIAGRYSGENFLEVDANINLARGAAAVLAKYGIDYFCPHMHTAHFDVIVPEVPYEYWLKATTRFLRNCNAVLLLEGWERSEGTLLEVEEAKKLGFPIFKSIPELLWAIGWEKV